MPPQSNNETSKFSCDACKDSKKIVANYENASFSGYAIGGISFESMDLVTSNIAFWSKKHNFNAGIDNKCCIKIIGTMLC